MGVTSSLQPGHVLYNEFRLITSVTVYRFFSMITIVANWKAHKSLSQARQWVNEFLENLDDTVRDKLDNDKLKIIICPPFPLLIPVKQLLAEYSSLSVGAQNISHLPEGKYTGEVPAPTLVGIASHVVVGHAERRELGDTPEEILAKVKACEEHGLKSILCMTQIEQAVPGQPIYSYEPKDAIGTGDNADVSDVLVFKEQLVSKLKRSEFIYLYGGSVNANNCGDYLQTKKVDGFLVGTVSLDALSFAQLVVTSASYA